MLPVTVVHNGKKGLSMEEKKIYTVYPGLVCEKLLPECILDSSSIGDIVLKVLCYFRNVDCDTFFVHLDYCEFNSFVYRLYLSLSHFLIISFGVFYQLMLDAVDVKEGE